VIARCVSEWKAEAGAVPSSLTRSEVMMTPFMSECWRPAKRAPDAPPWFAKRFPDKRAIRRKRNMKAGSEQRSLITIAACFCCKSPRENGLVGGIHVTLQGGCWSGKAGQGEFSVVLNEMVRSQGRWGGCCWKRREVGSRKTVKEHVVFLFSSFCCSGSWVF